MVVDTNRILLVEDNLAHALLVKRTLREFQIDFVVDHVTDGQLAREYLINVNASIQEFPYLVLLDLNLPKYDGFSTLK